MKPNTRNLAGGLLALGLWLAGITAASATGLAPGHFAERESRAVLAAVARSDLDAAFGRAGEIGRRDDAAAAARLAAQREGAVAASHRLGALRRVSTPQDRFFAGCVTRRFHAHYEGGLQVWQLKFRRAGTGWYLSDLDVRNP